MKKLLLTSTTLLSSVAAFNTLIPQTTEVKGEDNSLFHSEYLEKDGSSSYYIHGIINSVETYEHGLLIEFDIDGLESIYWTDEASNTNFTNEDIFVGQIVDIYGNDSNNKVNYIFGGQN
jgi:hypothetical protein